MLVSKITPLIASRSSTTRKILVLAGGKGEIQHTKLEESEKSVCWRDRRWRVLRLKALKLLSDLQEESGPAHTETKEGTCRSSGGRRVRDTTQHMAWRQHLTKHTSSSHLSCLTHFWCTCRFNREASLFFMFKFKPSSVTASEHNRKNASPTIFHSGA